MLIIDTDSVSAIRLKLDNTEKIQEVIDDVARMLEIKETLRWRSDAMAPCCGSLCQINTQLNHEVDILNDTLTALQNSDRTQAGVLLAEYIRILEENREREPDEPKYY